jgi:hypothetical protein
MFSIFLACIAHSAAEPASNSSRRRKAYVATEVAGIPCESMAQSGKGAPKRSEGGLVHVPRIEVENEFEDD